MAAVQLCQSVVAVGHGTQSWPCTLAASTVLHGIHLCGVHRAVWTRRLEAVQKIRIHPDRALPDQPGTEVLELRQCRTCGQAKPIESFYRSNGTSRMLDCAVCFNEQDRRRKRLTGCAVGGSPAVSPFSGADAHAETISRLAEALESGEEGAAPTESARSRGSADNGDPLSTDGESATSSEPVTGINAGSRAAREYSRKPTLWLVPFDCLLCGRFICEVKVATETASIQLRSGVRCRHCQGAPIRGEARRQVLPEVVDMGLSHHGRPTLAMVAARAEQAV